jgi:hypothetical protein
VKQGLHPYRQPTGVHQPNNDTIFGKHHLLVQTARWGSKGDKMKVEYIKMYFASVGKYDVRLIARIGLYGFDTHT